MKSFRISLLLLVLGVTTRTAAMSGDAERGKAVFHDKGKSSNGLACSTCHDTGDREPDSILRPAHTLDGVLGRPSYWGGKIDSFAEAAEFCAVKYMQIEGLGDSDTADIESYMSTLGTESQPPLPLAKRTRRMIPKVAKLQGDVERGKEIAGKSCIQCHEGKGPGPLLSETLSPRPIIIVILSTGGKLMPFFSTDRLGDQDVADVATYVSGINRSSK